MHGSEKPHSHGLRRGRVSLPGHHYLLTSVVSNREPLFRDFFVGRCVIRELHDADVQTLACVVMPDHFHWLIALRDAPLSRVMQTVKSRSAISVNKLLNRSGAVWQNGYHDHALRKDEDLRAAARYLVANPLRARLVDHVGRYPLWDAMWL